MIDYTLIKQFKDSVDNGTELTIYDNKGVLSVICDSAWEYDKQIEVYLSAQDESTLRDILNEQR